MQPNKSSAEKAFGVIFSMFVSLSMQWFEGNGVDWGV